MNPFDFVTSVSNSKKDIMTDEESERGYAPFYVNRALSYFSDTVSLANIVNQYHLMPHRLQYDFLLNTIRKRKRFSKWIKQDQESDIDAIREYYGYSRAKAQQVQSLLSPEQLEIIKKKVDKGG